MQVLSGFLLTLPFQQRFTTLNDLQRTIPLTYYAVLSLFAAVLAVVSLVGVVGQGPIATDALLKFVADIGNPEGSTPSAVRCSQSAVPPAPASRSSWLWPPPCGPRRAAGPPPRATRHTNGMGTSSGQSSTAVAACGAPTGLDSGDPRCRR